MKEDDLRQRLPSMLCSLTYRIHGLDDAFISTPPHLFRLETSRKCSASIGDFDRFPLELLHEVLTLLDLQSVVSFRIVNTKAVCILDAFSQYNTLATHAPEVLWALIATRVASHTTLFDLYNTLCTPDCAECSAFGAFFFLPECKRCCMRCLTVGSTFMPMSVPEAKRIFRLETEGIATYAPIVHTVPGRYAIRKVKYLQRTQLVSGFRIRDVLDKETGTNNAFDTWYRKHGQWGRGKDFYIGPGHIYRFMCATPFPYFDRKARKSHRGVFCKGCEIAMERKYENAEWIRWWREENEMFSEEGFLEHFKECCHAQDIWESRQESESLSS